MTTVVGGIRRRAYYFRRCKKVPASNIESLPNEVLIEILVRVSADDICEKARLVCRNWYHIIHSDAFINAHRENSNSNWGLLLTNLYRKEHPLFLGVREGRIEISELYEECFPPIPASCNGLVVSMDSPNSYTINFVNLATKQAFRSPPLYPCSQVPFCTFGIAYAAASMEYKVVRTYALDFTQPFCNILTAGVDNKCRCVGVDYLSSGAKELLLKFRDPLITRGFMHWTWKWEGTRVLTLNVETEMFTESHVHLVDDDGFARRRSMYYLSTGRRLSLLFACRDWVWEVWEMEGESGEWRKLLPNINLEAHKQRVEQELPNQYRGLLEPLGWVEYPVLLALYYGRTCFVYNLVTDEIDSIELPQKCRNYKAVVHRNTLERLS